MLAVNYFAVMGYYK